MYQTRCIFIRHLESITQAFTSALFGINNHKCLEYEYFRRVSTRQHLSRDILRNMLELLLKQPYLSTHLLLCMLCNVAVHVERHVLRAKCCLVETWLC
jgi:hypothetical protein